MSELINNENISDLVFKKFFEDIKLVRFSDI